jgi:hypothetical protein
MSYFIVWNIPYKKINTILKKEVKEDTEDNSNTGTSDTNTTTVTSGNRQ